jgi:GNAT superfamily N-acetyltransferase
MVHKSTDINVIPLTKEHLEAAAALVMARYREGRKDNPLWPDKYRKAEDVLPLFAYNRGEQVGVAAQRGGETVGFMVSFPWDNFGVPVAWVPDWSHGAAAEGRGDLYRRMYTALAKRWVAEGRLKHCAVTYTYERDVLEAFYSLGFGMHGLDAMRGMEAVPGLAEGITIRKAGPEDIDLLMELRWLLSGHLRQSPAFAFFPDAAVDAGAADFEKQVNDDSTAAFLAQQDGEIIGAMRVVPSSQADFKLPVFDDGACSINMAYTREDRRGKGVATALLNAVLAWGREKGYKRCGVDFESANMPGSRFWLKHFTPASYGLTRFVDRRVYQQLKERNQL